MIAFVSSSEILPMLTITSGTANRDCSGHSRRDFLRVGALGLAGLTLPRLLASRSLAADAAGRGFPAFVRDKAVVLLYLSGGASHIETFNPNMDAPAPFKSLTGEVKTSLPGVSFGGSFPRLAKLADKLAVVRSFKHSVGNHDAAHVHVLSGGTDPVGQGAAGCSMGSIISRLRGSSHPATGLPTYALLTYPEVDGQYSKEVERAVRGSWPGMLGPTAAPFRLDGGIAKPSKKQSSPQKTDGKKGFVGTVAGPTGSVAEDMALTLPQDRLEDRRALLESLDSMRRSIDSSSALAGAGQYERQAFELILGTAREAFDLSKEDPRIVERYDTSKMKVGHKQMRPSSLGKQMLLARRLVEAGAGFITVQSSGWDMHADGNNPGMVDGMKMLGPTVDQSVSAFLEDLDSRGLSEKVLLVITGDFGRTPKVNARGGRDHWANLGTLAFAGGGLKMGQVIGRADRGNGEPATEPISPQMMLATILHTVFDIGALRVARGIPQELATLAANGQPIRELF
jgi:uncharacterized protein (DUF1501 family)